MNAVGCKSKFITFSLDPETFMPSTAKYREYRVEPHRSQNKAYHFGEIVNGLFVKRALHLLSATQ